MTINENTTDARIAELARLGDRVVNYYLMSLNMGRTDYDEVAYSALNLMLLDAVKRYVKYWESIKDMEMDENEREKMNRTVLKIRDRVMRYI